MKNNELLMLVEIPQGSANKYEIDHATGILKLDRVLFRTYPTNYGSLWENKEAKTLNYDGDPIDVISLGETVFPGCLVPIRIIGVLKMIDSGEKDDKILAVNAVDPRLNDIKNITDVNKNRLAEISNFFHRYKELEGKEVIIQGWGDKSEAETILKNCQRLYQHYKEKINQGISKKELVKLLNKKK